MSLDKTIALEPGDGTIYRDMAHGESFRQIRDAAEARSLDNLRDRLDIVLSKFRCVVATRPQVLVVGLAAGRRTGWHGLSNAGKGREPTIEFIASPPRLTTMYSRLQSRQEM